MEVQGHTHLNEVPGDADAADLLTHTLRICFNSSSQRRDLHSKVQTHTASIISERPPGCPQSSILNTVHRSRLMAKPKSVCLMLSEAKQTETRSLEQRKAYLSQGLKARMGSSYSKARTLQHFLFKNNI